MFRVHMQGSYERFCSAFLRFCAFFGFCVFFLRFFRPDCVFFEMELKFMRQKVNFQKIRLATLAENWSLITQCIDAEHFQHACTWLVPCTIFWSKWASFKLSFWKQNFKNLPRFARLEHLRISTYFPRFDFWYVVRYFCALMTDEPFMFTHVFMLLHSSRRFGHRACSRRVKCAEF